MENEFEFFVFLVLHLRLEFRAKTLTKYKSDVSYTSFPTCRVGCTTQAKE
jgi:hypothetical protein